MTQVWCYYAMLAGMVLLRHDPSMILLRHDPGMVLLRHDPSLAWYGIVMP
jgi:hypothetical protein